MTKINAITDYPLGFATWYHSGAFRLPHSILPCLDPKLDEMECLSRSQEEVGDSRARLSKVIMKQRQVFFIQNGLKDLKSIFPIKLILSWILSGRHALSQAQYESKQGL